MNKQLFSAIRTLDYDLAEDYLLQREFDNLQGRDELLNQLGAWITEYQKYGDTKLLMYRYAPPVNAGIMAEYYEDDLSIILAVIGNKSGMTFMLHSPNNYKNYFPEYKSIPWMSTNSFYKHVANLFPSIPSLSERSMFYLWLMDVELKFISEYYSERKDILFDQSYVERCLELLSLDKTSD